MKKLQLENAFENKSLTFKRTFEFVFRNKKSNRNDILTLIESNPATVHRLIANMECKGLLSSYTESQGKRGQPTQFVKVNEHTLISAGIRFSHKSLEVSLVKFNGEWLGCLTEEIQENTVESLAKQALSMLSCLTKQHNQDIKQLLGFGISIPGNFKKDQENIDAHSYFPYLKDTNILSEFSKYLPLPVYIENDANCATLYELIIGKGTLYNNFINLYLGYGVSSGLAFNNKLYRGKNGNAGLIGYQFPSSVCLRPSGQNLLEFLRKQNFNVNSFEDLESIYTEAQPYIQDWVNHTSTQLKEKLYTTSRLLDLDAIIIGGGLPKRVIQSIHNCINSATFLPPEDELPCPDIICSDIGPKVNVYGAALVPIYRECFPT